MNWQEVIGYEFIWLGLGLIALAAGIGLLDLFIKLTGDDDE